MCVTMITSLKLVFTIPFIHEFLDIFFISSSGDIKHILENELQIPASKMLLKGWKTGDVDDSVSFQLCFQSTEFTVSNWGSEGGDDNTRILSFWMLDIAGESSVRIS